MATVANTQGGELARHAETYHRFMLGVKWVAISLASTMVFLTLWFATPAGFWSGLLGGVIVFGVGVYAMNQFLAHSTEDDNPH
jgi:hypothetical protein